MSRANSFAPIYAPAGTGLADLNLAQEWQSRLEVFPDPAGDIFAGGVVESGNVVQVVVIQLFEDGFEAVLEFGEVHDPSCRLRCITLCAQSHTKRVPMQARALMSRRDVGQAMRCLKVKLFVDFHVRALCVGALSAAICQIRD